MGTTHLMSRIASDQLGTWAHIYEGDHQMTGDNDGVMSNNIKCRIDLSQALSQRLGRQMSMMSVYKVNYIKLALRNIDDSNDNDGGMLFQGKLHHWGPSKHRINAMKLARQIEDKQGEDLVGDVFGPLDNNRTYKGMRFNWDSDNQTFLATTENFSVLSGQQWDMHELFNIYEASQLTNENTYSNALWTSGRCGYPNQMGVDISMTNMISTERAIFGDDASFDIFDPKSAPFEIHFGDAPIEVLGGLLVLDLTHSAVDNGQLTTVDDEFALEVTIGVTGWSDF